MASGWNLWVWLECICRYIVWCIPNLSTPNMSTIPNFFSTCLKLKKGYNSVKYRY